MSKTAAGIVEKAVSQIGVNESPAGSDNQKYDRLFGWGDVPWCLMFVLWSLRECGASSLFCDGKKGLEGMPTQENGVQQ